MASIPSPAASRRPLPPGAGFLVRECAARAIIFAAFNMRVAATLIVVGFYLLHQDFWLWLEARPLVFGILPAGLFYHVVYVLVCSLVLWGLVTFLWPSHLEGSEKSRE